MRLDIYLNETKDTSAQDAMTLLEDIMFLENFEQLNEAVEDIKVKTVNSIKDITTKMSTVLDKGGVHVKQSKGLMQYFWNTNKGIAKLFYHAFMAAKTGDEGHKTKIKEIMKSVKVADILDILLKVDMVTMHLFTGPIHIIDAITGTHIWANVSGKAKAGVEKAKAAIEALEQAKDDLTGKMKAQTQKYINALRRVFDIGDYKKVA